MTKGHFKSIYLIPNFGNEVYFRSLKMKSTSIKNDWDPHPVYFIRKYELGVSL